MVRGAGGCSGKHRVYEEGEMVDEMPQERRDLQEM
jgi:hypothetical protein